MKIWKVYYNHPVHGECIRFKSSLRDARYRLNRVKEQARKNDWDCNPCGYQQVVVPANRFTLIDWLNELQRKDDEDV